MLADGLRPRLGRAGVEQTELLQEQGLAKNGPRPLPGQLPQEDPLKRSGQGGWGRAGAGHWRRGGAALGVEVGGASRVEGQNVPLTSRTPCVLLCEQVFPHSQDVSSSRFTGHVRLDKNLIYVGLGFLKGTLKSLSLRDPHSQAGLLGTGLWASSRCFLPDRCYGAEARAPNRC